MIFYFRPYFIFFNVNEHLAVPFVELATGGSRVSHLHFFCLQRITWLRIPTVIQTYLTYCLKSSLLLAFCFVSLYMVDQTQLYPLSISLLALFQGMIYNLHSVYRGWGFLKNHRWVEINTFL